MTLHKRSPDNDKIIVKRSIRAVLLYVILGAVFALVASMLLYQSNLGGWCFVPMAMGLFFAGIGGLLDRSPRLIITDSGLTVRALGPEEIPWHKIQSVTAEFVPKAGNTLILWFQDGSKQRVYIDVLEMPPDEVLRILKGRISDNHY